jgi:hypothetical protein
VLARQTAKPPADEFKIALDNRAFEIQLFWQRSNYFLVLMTALGIGTFSIKSVSFSPLVAMFAVICSALWFKTNLGSKFWQEFWEAEVAMLAKGARVKAFEKTTSEAIDQVRVSLSAGSQPADSSILRRWVYDQVIRKPSVTYHMILLSLSATIVWAIVFIALLWRAWGVYRDSFLSIVKWWTDYLCAVAI